MCPAKRVTGNYFILVYGTLLEMGLRLNEHVDGSQKMKNVGGR